MDTNAIVVLIFEFVVLMLSAVVHEVSHGYEADRLGDNTARIAGRLTLNPLKHMDFFGSFLMPLTLLFISNGSFFFAYAKPVPYDPRNLKNPRTGSAKIAFAGPLSNLLIALFFGIIIRIISSFSILPFFLELLAVIVYLNIMLAIFNLVPIPPLDGSKILFSILPQNIKMFRFEMFLERYGMFIVLFFVFFFFQLIIPIVNWIFFVFTGANFGL